MVRLFDGSAVLKIELGTCFFDEMGIAREFEDNTLAFFDGVDWREDREGVVGLVDDCDYCLEQAEDWAFYRGDYEVEDDGREHCKEERSLNYVLGGDC